MKIRRLETFGNEFVCFVRLTTDDGHVGWGQTSTYNADITAMIFHRQVTPWALGADAFDIAGLIAGGISPEAVADEVADAVDANRFYILTHPDSLAMVQQRMEAILDGGVPPFLLPQ